MAPTINVSDTLLSLTKEVEKTFSFFRHLYVAVLGSRAFSEFDDEVIETLRIALKDHWANGIQVPLLAHLYRIMDSLITLSQSVDQESKQEGIDFLKTILLGVVTFEGFCQPVLTNNLTLSRYLQEHKKTFGLSKSQFPKPFSKPPEAASAAASLISSLEQTQTHLTIVAQFPNILREGCTHLLEVESLEVLISKCQSSLSTWNMIRADSLDAVSNLTWPVDAIAGKLPPRRRRKTWGIKVFITCWLPNLSVIVRPSPIVLRPLPSII